MNILTSEGTSVTTVPWSPINPMSHTCILTATIRPSVGWVMYQGAISGGGEDNFGGYGTVNPDRRCSANSTATTQWWLGGP